MLLQRYNLIQQRILRQDIFQNKLSINNSSTSSHILKNEQHKLTPIEGLLGTNGYKTLLGILVQIEQNQYYIEDPTGSVPIDLSHVTIPSRSSPPPPSPVHAGRQHSVDPWSRKGCYGRHHAIAVGTQSQR